MPVNIDTITSDVQVESRGGSAQSTTPSTTAMPEAPDILRWRLAAHAVSRNLMRLRATDQDD